jgi:hypothetical protein
MAILDRNYIIQNTMSRGDAVVEKSISSAPFFTLFSPHIFHRHHQLFARIYISLFSYGTNS